MADYGMVNDRRNSNFITFMRNLISVHLRNVTHVSKFYLYLECVYPADEINAWISAFSRLRMSHFLMLSRDESGADVSSDVIFRSASFKSLIFLHLKFVKNISSSVYLPNLKNLCLIHVTFSDGDSLERVIAACPVLISLTLRNCKIGSVVRVLRISSASVEEVTICMMTKFCNNDTYDLDFDMPSLKSLHYEDHVPEKYYLKNFSSISKAYIDLVPCKEQITGNLEMIWHRFQNVGNFVEACSLVRSLHLSSITVVALRFLSQPLPIFHNLNNLTLTQICSTGCELLPRLLETAPNLEVLVFKGGLFEYTECFSKFRNCMPDHLPMCLTSHLHTIKFEEFKGEKDELNLVEYFLNYAHVLGKIEICFSCSVAVEKLRSTKSKLWSLRHNSKKCQVEFEFSVEFDYTKF